MLFSVRFFQEKKTPRIKFKVCVVRLYNSIYTVLYLLYCIYKYTYIILYINFNLYLFFGFLLLTCVTFISKAFSSVCFSVYIFPCYILPKTPRLNIFFPSYIQAIIYYDLTIYLVCSSQTLYRMNRNHCQLTIIIIAQKTNNNNNNIIVKRNILQYILL